MYELLDAGVPNIFLKSGYVFRETRYGRGVSITNVEGLTRAIIIALCLRGGRLRGVEFRYIRRAIGHTQEALSKLFDRTEQTIANWEKRNQVPLEASLLLKEQALVQFDLGHLVHQVLGQLGQSHLSDEMIILSFDPHRLIWTSNFHAPATKPHAFVGYTAHTTSGSSWLFGSEQETTTHDYLPRKTRAKFAHYVPPTRTYQ